MNGPAVRAEELEAWTLRIEGRVQGVGFRPFIYRLAHATGINGWVLNGAGRVEIAAEGSAAAIDRFCRKLVDSAPPAAQPRLAGRAPARPVGYEDFRIRSSSSEGPALVCVPPDQFACPDCLQELTDPTDRRYGYPFINCTQCGPRYTIIESLPYDRPNTSMAGFELCEHCRSEYQDPLDRRFHAQPLACPDCGPKLTAAPPGEPGAEDPLAAAVEWLRDGRIVAVRGIGGYHLMCDPTADRALARLRRRKHRPHKPLALMVPERGEDGLQTVREIAELTDGEGAMLRDPRRPIVLARKRPGGPLSELVAPELGELGLMLPYSPLHHLLLDAFGGPLVATSGNLSGEPVLTDAGEADRRLAGIADGFLHHDRPIVRPADDPVYRRLHQELRPLRLGRGTAPLEFELPEELEQPVLAVGAFMKNTIALGVGRRVIVSPHIGELDTPRSREVFRTVIDDLRRLYSVRPETVACDAHPDYPNTRWTRTCGLPVRRIFHHHAHASAVYGEAGMDEPILCFTWDGTGLGVDGTIWGGELLAGSPGSWHRAGSLRPFGLPGGERAAREGWRAALGLCWEANVPLPSGARWGNALLRQAWEAGLNTPRTTSAGRLFDGAAALIGIRSESSFEGHAPMALESLAATADEAHDLPLLINEDPGGIVRIDWQPLLEPLADPAVPRAVRARTFHLSLIRAMAEQADIARAGTGLRRIGLAGGVFQNRLLTELLVAELQSRAFEVLIPLAIPMNDAGISFGQIIEANAQLKNG